MTNLESRILKLEQQATPDARRFVVVRDVDEPSTLPTGYRPGVDELIEIVGIDPDMDKAQVGRDAQGDAKGNRWTALSEFYWFQAGTSRRFTTYHL